jgi:antitoxin component of MazEF toxin-antitoxin module
LAALLLLEAGLVRAVNTAGSATNEQSAPAAIGISLYILTVMKVVKVRRVGNSNVVSIPREFETSGYTPGASVLIDELADGELRILPTDRVRDRVRQIADRVVDEHPEAMEILASHDPERDNRPA